jgi:hypothetical protein
MALALSGVTYGSPVTYDLSVVAKTGDTISGKTLTGFKLPSLGANSPAINSSGEVAFYATYSEGAYVGEGVFTPSALVAKTGGLYGGQPLSGMDFVPALKDGGAVVIRGLLSSGESAILTSAALVARCGDSIGGQTVTSLGLPAVNNSGAMAFVGSFAGGTGVFSQSALLAKSGDVIAGQMLGSLGQPAINDHGTVAFQSWSSGTPTTAIFTPSAVLVQTGDTIGGKTLTDLLFGSTINASGIVAFTGVFSGGTGIFTQNALLVKEGDRIGGQKLTSFGYPVLNDSGTVAFFATYPGGAGIFTKTALIAKTGDTLGGQTLVGLGQPAINNSGAIAFAASFSNGSSAIIVARPITAVSAGTLRQGASR